ncbi:hypothetical protein H4R35_000136 [Dimargaris xerosporica]|nr:hypothetical protein H4R35_000136 [Dimargaris xerosporica]
MTASLQPYVGTGRKPGDEPGTDFYEATWQMARDYEIHLFNDVHRQPKPMNAFLFIQQLKSSAPTMDHPDAVAETIQAWTNHVMQVTSDLVSMSADFVAFVAKSEVSPRITKSHLSSAPNNANEARTKAASAYDFIVRGIRGDFAEPSQELLENLVTHFLNYDEMKDANKAISLEAMGLSIQPGLDLSASTGGRGEALKHQLQALSQARRPQQSPPAVSASLPPPLPVPWPLPPHARISFQEPKVSALQQFLQQTTQAWVKGSRWLRRQSQQTKEKLNSLRRKPAITEN